MHIYTPNTSAFKPHYPLRQHLTCIITLISLFVKPLKEKSCYNFFDSLYLFFLNSPISFCSGYRLGSHHTTRRLVKVPIRPKAPYFAEKWRFCRNLPHNCRSLHLLFKAIYWLLSENGSDDFCRKVENFNGEWD